MNGHQVICVYQKFLYHMLTAVWVDINLSLSPRFHAYFWKKLFEGMCWSLSQRIHTGQVSVHHSLTNSPQTFPEWDSIPWSPCWQATALSTAPTWHPAPEQSKTVFVEPKSCCNMLRDLIYGSPVNPEALLTERSDCVHSEQWVWTAYTGYNNIQKQIHSAIAVVQTRKNDRETGRKYPKSCRAV